MFRSPALPRRFPAPAFSLLPVPALPAVFRRAVLTIGCLAALLVPSFARAQAPGDLDTGFTSVLLGSSYYALSLHDVGGTPLLFAAGDFDAIGQLTDTGRNADVFTYADFGSLQRLIYTAVPEVIPFSPLIGPKLLLGGLFGRFERGSWAETDARAEGMAEVERRADARLRGTPRAM